MKRILLLLICAVGFHFSEANHIVGGEIELIHIEGSRYRINLIQYFDLAQDQNPGPEASIVVYTFRNTDDFLMRRDTLSLSGSELVPYTNVLCIIDELLTLRAIYTVEVTLDPDEFDNPEGYYMVWERCCRNFGVNNILNPGGTGMTYFLEFPPVVKNGEPFINSSPQLFPPLSDYACVNQLYYVDFAGTDVDGDSIAYSLVTPLNSTALVPVPIPTPKPHPEVRFLPGISVNNMVPGSPSLGISSKGFITVTPSQVGLYVFSVLAEEFRDGEKIGEVRRDFQLLVVTNCDPPEPPETSVKVPGQPNFDPVSQQLNYTIGDEDKCFEFLVRDNSDGVSRVNLRAEGVNFDGDVSDIFSINSGFIVGSQDTLAVEVCVGRCPYVQDGPYIIDLIASDDACPLPQQDTLRLTINVESPPNEDPVFETIPAPEELFLDENQNRIFSIVGTDADQDFLAMDIEAVGFDPSDFGFTIGGTSDGRIGRVERSISWNTDCALFELGGREDFVFDVSLEDADECLFESGVVEQLVFNVNLPENTTPILSADISSTEITAEFGSVLGFNVSATDADGDTIQLRAVGENISLAQLGASFPTKLGVDSVSQQFEWDISCGSFEVSEDNEYTFSFIAEDLDRCQNQNADTIEVTVILVVPDNNAPFFDNYDDLELLVNQDFSLDIVARDVDPDFLELRLRRNVFFDNFEFIPASGQGMVVGTLNWRPDCSLLGPGFSDEEYQISFLVTDNRCPEELSAILDLNITLRQPESGEVPFLPANAFTPNDDGINDFFTLTNLDPPERNLPPELCENVFEFIRIFDRTGKEIFFSKQKEFSWDGDGFAGGTYYYFIKYTATEYKGYINLIY